MRREYSLGGEITTMMVAVLIVNLGMVWVLDWTWQHVVDLTVFQWAPLAILWWDNRKRTLGPVDNQRFNGRTP